MDRVVKIWRVHDHEGQLRREDKPLYSSTLVHRSAAASVVWYVGLSDRCFILPIMYSGYPKIRFSPIALRPLSRATSCYQMKNVNPPGKTKRITVSRSGPDALEGSA